MSYEMIAGTPADRDEQHEARTIKRTKSDGRTYIMTEISDGGFVEWSTCDKCRLGVAECSCPSGPVEPAYIQRWRTQRFEDSFKERGVLPALPERLRHRDRRVAAVIRLLQSQGWTIEPPPFTCPKCPDYRGVSAEEHELHMVEHIRQVTAKGKHPSQAEELVSEDVDTGLDAALEAVQTAKEDQGV